MKNYLVLLLSFIMAFAAYGGQEETEQEQEQEQEEAKNENAFKTFISALGNNGDEEDDRGGYFSVSVSPIISADALNKDAPFFAESTEGLVRAGEVPLESDIFKLYNNGQVALGYATNSGFRYQGGLKWMEFGLGQARYNRFDFAPIDLETLNANVALNGEVAGMGPVGSVYYDSKIGNREGFQDWFYVGTTFGLIKADLNYDLDIFDYSTTGDSSAWVKMNQIELGTVIGPLEIGYEWTRYFDTPFDNVDGNGSMLNLQPFSRHAVKIGLLHLFTRR